MRQGKETESRGEEEFHGKKCVLWGRSDLDHWSKSNQFILKKFSNSYKAFLRYDEKETNTWPQLRKMYDNEYDIQQ